MAITISRKRVQPIIVEFNGEKYVVRRVLSREKNNMKLMKGKDVLTVGVSLSPHKLSGHQVCQWATAGCIEGCINTAGNGRYDTVQLWRGIKTVAWFKHRKWFKQTLAKELWLAERRAQKKGFPLACRLNVFSDIGWDQLFPELFETFPKVQFYDYTKSIKRMRRFLNGELPPNWHLTFSRSEKNEADCVEVLERLGTVAVPFRGGLPETYLDHPVIDGDKTDQRFMDEPGTVVGLKVKGKGRSDRTSGFIVDLTV